MSLELQSAFLTMQEQNHSVLKPIYFKRIVAMIVEIVCSVGHLVRSSVAYILFSPRFHQR